MSLFPILATKADTPRNAESDAAIASLRTGFASFSTATAQQEEVEEHEQKASKKKEKREKKRDVEITEIVFSDSGNSGSDLGKKKKKTKKKKKEKKDAKKLVKRGLREQQGQLSVSSSDESNHLQLANISKKSPSVQLAQSALKFTPHTEGLHSANPFVWDSSSDPNIRAYGGISVYEPSLREYNRIGGDAVLGVKSKKRRLHIMAYLEWKMGRALDSRQMGAPDTKRPKRYYKCRLERKDDEDMVVEEEPSEPRKTDIGEYLRLSSGFIPLVNSGGPRILANASVSALSKKNDELQSSCTPDATAAAWLALADFQWDITPKATGTVSQASQVSRKQRDIFDKALQYLPGERSIHAALLRAEAGETPDSTALVDARRTRLLRNAYSEAAVELCWGYAEAVAHCYEQFSVGRAREVAIEALAALAARKVLTASPEAKLKLEDAELEVVWSVVLVESASGHPARALALLQANAMLNTFMPGAPPQRLREYWNEGRRLGEKGALYLLRGLRLTGAATWSGSSPELPEGSLALADAVESFTFAADVPVHASAFTFPATTGKEGALGQWVVGERERSIADTDVSMTFEELQPFLVSFNGEIARRETLLRFLDVLGSPILARHASSPSYRRGFVDAFVTQELRPPVATTGGFKSTSAADFNHWLHGNVRSLNEYLDLPWAEADRPAGSGGVEWRPGMIARTAAQGLAVWPRDPWLIWALLEACWTQGVSQKLPKLALRAAGDETRLFFAFASGLWRAGDANKARQVLAGLCQATPADARVACGWAHLELIAEHKDSTGTASNTKPEHLKPVLPFEGRGMAAQVTRVICAHACKTFTAEVLNPAKSANVKMDSGVQCLQAATQLQQALPDRSRSDAGGFPLLLSSFHATVFMICALTARTSPRKTLELFKKIMISGQSAGIEENRCRRLVAQFVVDLVIASPNTTPQLLLETLEVCLQYAPRSPRLMKLLAAAHLRRGTVCAMRRSLDSALAIHRPPSLRDDGCPALALRVVLEADLATQNISVDRLTALCERALATIGSMRFGGAASWTLYHLALRAAQQRCVANAEMRWRVAVRAVQRHPYAKTLWLEQLTAWEDNAVTTNEDADEAVMDLVEAIERRQIRLLGDPLEAIA